ncbi:MAG: Fe-S cluster assembly protein SufD [Acidimicrobiales bacterium]
MTHVLLDRLQITGGPRRAPLRESTRTTLSAFTIDAARALPGPEWLRDRRVAAAERFAASTLPTPDEEVWRYSRVAELDLDAFALEPQPTAAPIPAALTDALATVADPAAVVHVVNGKVVMTDVHDPRVVAGPAATADGNLDSLGSVMAEPADVFAVLNDAFCLDPVVVRVPAGVAVPGPIVIVHWSDTGGLAVFPRLVVEVGEGAQAAVLDVHVSSEQPAFSAPVAELSVGRAARLGYVNVQRLGLATWQIGSTVASVDADATFLSACGGLGGDYARQRTDCRLVGRGATGNLLAVYFGEGEQMLDFRTFQDHAAPDTTSDLLFKGAVAGHSRSVYTGLIRVRKNARGTNAFQTNRNIKLSDGAWAESVPNLEIENNDVRCSHASAVGPIDENQRFYLESRGVPPLVAERLVVMGFFDEVLEKLPVPGAAPALRAEIAGKLARRFD